MALFESRESRTKRMEILLTPSEYTWLVDESQRKGVSIAEILRRGLRLYVEQETESVANQSVQRDDK